MRGRGIGRRLLAGVEAWAAAKGADTIRLDVFANNDLGFEFWQRNGFEVRLHTMSRP
jgi:ribosomal protein S18 acetylase RimI-like enzyme